MNRSFNDYLDHYFSMPDIIYFLLVSLGIVLVIHFILLGVAKVKASQYGEDKKAYLLYFEDYSERYYELIFSSTSILLFISIYFWIDMDYFQLTAEAREMWVKYQDFLLLGFIIISALFNNIIDHLFVPLYRLDDEKRNTLRMMGMIYMMVVFAYIKLIYEDNNYDTILFYFITLVIGRFVYFDASFSEFCQAIKRMVLSVPILLLVLLSTALLALYGFGTDYLLRSNGVVGSLFIAHFFVIAEIFIVARTGAFIRLCRGKRSRKKEVGKKITK